MGGFQIGVDLQDDIEVARGMLDADGSLIPLFMSTDILRHRAWALRPDGYRDGSADRMGFVAVGGREVARERVGTSPDLCPGRTAGAGRRGGARARR